MGKLVKLLGATLASGSLALVMAAAATAQEAADIDALYEAAKQEGKVVYYNSSVPETAARFITAFEETYPGVAVEVTRLGSGALAQRYAAEAESGNVVADVIQQTSTAMLADAFERGWLVEIDDLPAHQAVPDQYKTPYGALAGLFPYSFAINIAQVSGEDMPTSYEDLLDPKWQGRITIPDPRNSETLMAWMWDVRRLYGDEYLTALKGQNVRWASGAVQAAQFAAAGEAAIMLPASLQSVTPLITAGAPLEVLSPAPQPIHAVESNVGISESAPNPNAARLLVNFLLSPEGQAAFLEGEGTSALGEIAGTLNMTDEVTRVVVDEVSGEFPEIDDLLF